MYVNMTRNIVRNIVEYVMIYSYNTVQNDHGGQIKMAVCTYIIYVNLRNCTPNDVHNIDTEKNARYSLVNDSSN